MFEKVFAVMFNTQRSPLAPLEKGGNGLKVPLFRSSPQGFRGIKALWASKKRGIVSVATCERTFKTSSEASVLQAKTVNITTR